MGEEVGERWERKRDFTRVTGEDILTYFIGWCWILFVRDMWGMCKECFWCVKGCVCEEVVVFWMQGWYGFLYG